MRVNIFCRVIDNYGDAGVCWRLARELCRSGAEVTLCADRLEALSKICPRADAGASSQTVLCGDKPVAVLRWDENLGREKLDPGDLVIEAFACDPPEDFTRSLPPETVRINLEYLSAEDWVEGCHKLPSPGKGRARKFFFFPGFTEKTGGLNFNRENILIAREIAASPAARKSLREALAGRLGFPAALAELYWCFVFTYETDNLGPLLEAVCRSERNVLFLIPEGRAAACLKKRGVLPALAERHPGAVFFEFPMQEQSVFDRLLMCSDLGAVRGEDSLAQALAFGVPCFWHIYGQEDGAHLVKLGAMLDRFGEVAGPEISRVYRDALTIFNDPGAEGADVLAKAAAFMRSRLKIREVFLLWAERLRSLGSLCDNLLIFMRDLTGKTPVSPSAGPPGGAAQKLDKQ